MLTEWIHAQQPWEVGCKSSSMLQKHEQLGQLCALLAREHQPLNRALVPAVGLAAAAVPSASANQLLEAVSQLESLHRCQITLQLSCLCWMRTASTLQFSCLCWMRTASTWHLQHLSIAYGAGKVNLHPSVAIPAPVALPAFSFAVLFMAFFVVLPASGLHLLQPIL